MFIHSRFGLPTLVEGSEIIARYKGPEFLIGRRRRAGHSSKSRTRSHSSPSVDLTWWGELRVLFLNSPCLVLFVFFFQTELLCYHLHLQNGNIYKVRLVMVLLTSEPKCSARFLKLTLVMATPLWLPNFPSLQNHSSSTWAYGWALLGHFPLPYLRHFALEVRISWDLWNSPADDRCQIIFLRRRYLWSNDCIIRSESGSYSFPYFFRTSANNFVRISSKIWGWSTPFYCRYFELGTKLPHCHVFLGAFCFCLQRTHLTQLDTRRTFTRASYQAFYLSIHHWIVWCKWL